MTNQEIWDLLHTPTITLTEWEYRVENGYKGKPYNYEKTAWWQIKEALLAEPAPTPTPTGAVEPLWLITWGPDLSGFQHPEKYGGIGVGIAQKDYANKYENVWCYGAAPDVNKNWSAGVDLSWAQANDKLLKDPSGNLLINQGYPDDYIGDIGDPAYQQEFVAGTLRNIGNAAGVWIDDIGRDPTVMCGTYPAKYPSVDAWQAANISFLEGVVPALHAAGKKVGINCTAYTRGDSLSNTGELTTNYWKLIASSKGKPDYITNEYWMETAEGSNTIRVNGEDSWMKFADHWITLVDVAEDSGMFPLCITYGNDESHFVYGFATFLMRWDGKGGGFIFGNGDDGDPYPYTSKYFGIGSPLDPQGTNPRGYSSGKKVGVDLDNGTAYIS